MVRGTVDHHRHVPPRDRGKGIPTITATAVALVHGDAARSAAIFARTAAKFGTARLEQLLDLLGALQALDLRDPD